MNPGGAADLLVRDSSDETEILKLAQVRCRAKQKQTACNVNNEQNFITSLKCTRVCETFRWDSCEASWCLQEKRFKCYNRCQTIRLLSGRVHQHVARERLHFTHMYYTLGHGSNITDIYKSNLRVEENVLRCIRS